MLGPLQKQFVDALRSGKYKQGKGVLCHEDKYCCLGVACEVEGTSEKYEDRHGNHYYNRECVSLPESVAKKMCFRGRSGTAINGMSLMEMNDAGNKTFIEIADAIENDPHNFFVRPA